MDFEFNIGEDYRGLDNIDFSALGIGAEGGNGDMQPVDGRNGSAQEGSGSNIVPVLPFKDGILDGVLTEEHMHLPVVDSEGQQ